MLAYIAWRGDLSLEQSPFSPVDGLILSTLAYVRFQGCIPADAAAQVSLAEAVSAFLSRPAAEQGRVRSPSDAGLMRRLAASRRFAHMRLTAYQDVFLPEKEMQFAAYTALLEDGTAFLAFRGTDSTLVGWKEDFNMSFRDTVPAQSAALEYAERIAAAFGGALRLGGHSKGGNLAIYAATQCPPQVRGRILAVYNNDGPGFTDSVLSSPGYAELLERIHSFVPQSSIIGMLLQHEDDYTVVHSRQRGILQHDPYSWSVLGNDFIRLRRVTEGSRITDKVVKDWLCALTPEERGKFVDVLYELLSAGGASLTSDLVQPRSLYATLKAYKAVDEDTRRLLSSALKHLLDSAVGNIAAADDLPIHPGRQRISARQRGILPKKEDAVCTDNTESE